MKTWHAQGQTSRITCPMDGGHRKGKLIAPGNFNEHKQKMLKLQENETHNICTFLIRFWHGSP